MGSTDTPARTPSISELQAALLAARNGAFAATAGPVAEAEAVPPGSGSAAPAPGTAPRRQMPPPPSGPVPSEGVRTWLLGVHGGSGARSLARVLAGTRTSDGAWPIPPLEAAGPSRVVLVCRSSQRGLSAAQEYARRFRDEDMHDRCDLLGVIVSADAPGRLPPPLRRLVRLLSGATPVLGEIPWQPAWRLAPAQPLTEVPVWLTKLQQALTAAGTRWSASGSPAA